MYILLVVVPILSAFGDILTTTSPKRRFSNNSDIPNVPGSSKKLTEFLLSNHNLYAPPDGVLDVHYELELVHILGIDELKQTMKVLVYLDEKWVDASLSWDPAHFGGVQKTWLPMDKIWIPDIITLNMLDHEDLLSSVRATAVIYSNGSIIASHPAVHTVSCEINIQHFPLDDQRCSLQIASWAYDTDKIRLYAHMDHSVQNYVENEEWLLLNMSVDNETYDHEGIRVSELKFNIQVKRRPLFYMVTLTFPSYVMCAISVVGLFAKFSTTGEREERFTLGVTAILTMAVLSLVVSEKVPHSSTHVPLLVAYFLFNMITVSIAAMTTGLVMRVHRLGRFGHEPHPWVLRLFCLGPIKGQWNVRDAMADEIDMQAKTALLESPKQNGDITIANGESHQPLLRKIATLEGFVRKLASTCENIQGELEDFDLSDPQLIRRRKEHNGYVRIAERLDLILMSFFLAIVTVPVLILFWESNTTNNTSTVRSRLMQGHA